LSFSNKESYFKQYFLILEEEIKKKAEILKDYNVSSVYFGGGTPTLPSAEFLISALNAIKCNFKGDFSLIEITIEANPETVNREKLSELRNGGFNRISFGAQTFSNKILKKIGRIHTAEKFFSVFNDARDSDFKNINIDLMFALPDQTIDNVAADVTEIIKLNPEHISYYGLTLAENTPLALDSSFIPTDDVTDRLMYDLIVSELKEAGYIHYEISNFSKTGFESKHNCSYWNGTDYIGLGFGAHSLICDERFHNTEIFAEYLKGHNKKENCILLSESDKQSEFFFLGLRKLSGVSESDFLKKFKKSCDEIYGIQLQKLEKDNLITRENGIIKLTKLGIDLSNIVFREFIF
jgi:oxygen-independent coproporphyrinogen-3 oxidase